MSKIDPRLREDVHLLGELLGQTIRDDRGEDFLACIERIRQAAKACRQRDGQAALQAELARLDDSQLLPVVRAFSQLLNLANIAEQYQQLRREPPSQAAQLAEQALPQLLRQLREQGHAADALAQRLGSLDIDLVLTAHPTEVARRTLIQKYDAIAAQLAALDHADLLPVERQRIHQRLQQLVAEAWHTDEIRHARPTPVDEAKWGFAVIEHSLWQAVPEFLR